MNKQNMTWAFLMHMGFNMWTDPEEKDGIHCHPTRSGINCASDVMRFDRNVWNDTIDKLKKGGCNTIVIDIGEAMKLESYPEFAAKDAFSKKELADEVSRLTDMGFNVIPKYNFSAGHNVWMGNFGRMVSTPEYYKFCDAVIDEACEVFPKADLFHLGMDEECESIQLTQLMCIIRRGELYWHDQNLLFKRVEKNGKRPWIWADYVWHTPEREEEFLKNMTKDVLLSNWYYQQFEHPEGDWHIPAYKAFELLDKHGFDQIPTGGNFVHRNNIDLLYDFCTERLNPELLKGFCMTTWHATLPEKTENLFEAVDAFSEVIEKHNNK